MVPSSSQAVVVPGKGFAEGSYDDQGDSSWVACLGTLIFQDLFFLFLAVES